MDVEIFSDIACPWCYVGKRRFEAALEAFEHRDAVTVTWRSFELDPAAPRERSEDGATHLARKYGTSRAEAVAMQDRMTPPPTASTSASTSRGAATRSTPTASCTSPPPTASRTR